MATQENVGGGLSLVASADLSTKQYYVVDIDSNGRVAVAGQGEAAVGVLQDKPSAALAICNVAPFNGRKLKAVAGGVIAIGSKLTPSSTGKLEVAATGDFIIGYALEAAAADGDIIQFVGITAGVSA